MPIIPQVLDYRDELIAIRRDIHAHPELAFAEQRISDLVAGKLAEYGCEVYRGSPGPELSARSGAATRPPLSGCAPIWTRCPSRR